MRLSEAVAGSAARLRGLLADPQAAQADLLQRLLAANAQSRFGRQHGFGAIGNAREFAARVPVSRWSDLAAWVERAAAGEPDVLASGPVLAFEETGGSSTGRKLVPYNTAALQGFRRGLLPWLDDLFQAHPGLDAGRMYWAISPACRPPALSPGGIPVGLPGDAAYFGAELAPLVLERLAVPPEVGTIADFGAWRAATLDHLLRCRDLTMISVWSPSFLTELLRHADSAFDAARAWPQLRVISCWDQAGAAAGARQLRERFPGVTVQGKGLLATEGLVTVPLTGHACPVLALESGYWEFVDAGGRARGAHEVEEGADYSLLMTTASGFWRYAIGDRVRIAGFAQRTPMLEFIGREETSDLCGEKLTDAFAGAALARLGLAFAQVCPAPQGSGYVLLLDDDEVREGGEHAAAAQVDAALAANPQYAYARKLGQLTPVQPVRVQRPLQRWLARGRERGQRLGDIKLPALGPRWDWDAR